MKVISKIFKDIVMGLSFADVALFNIHNYNFY